MTARPRARRAWQAEARWLRQQSPDVIRGYVLHVDAADAPASFKRTIAALTPPTPAASSPTPPAPPPLPPPPPDRPSRARPSDGRWSAAVRYGRLR
jgi:hypothetical protein